MLVDLSLESLLDTESFSLGLLLRLQGGGHRLHGALMVLPGIVELFLLLSDPPVNLLLGLSQLELCPQDLVFLLLQSAFGLLQSSLQLLLLQPPPLLVQVMDGPSTFSQLVKKVLDFISE